MAEVVWTTRAAADLEALGAYLAREAPGYAERLVRRLLGSVERLGTFPESGREVPEMAGSGIREVVYRNYRVVYLFSPDAGRVEVLTVFHASRQFGASRDPGAAPEG